VVAGLTVVLFAGDPVLITGDPLLIAGEPLLITGLLLLATALVLTGGFVVLTGGVFCVVGIGFCAVVLTALRKTVATLPEDHKYRKTFRSYTILYSFDTLRLDSSNI